MPGLVIPNISTVASLLNSVHIVGFGGSHCRQSPHLNPDCIGRLSVELLREIFIWMTYPTEKDPEVLEDDDDDLRERTPVFADNHRVTPFPLAQVCRRWRGVVQDYKALWRSIAIFYPNKRHIHRVALWMSYVRHHPLQVTFIEHKDPSDDDREAILELFRLIAQRCHRWSTLDLRIGGDTASYLSSQLTKLQQFRSPVLENVDIRVHDVAKPATVDNMWQALQTIPSMWALKWNYADRMYTPPYRFNWQIKVLVIDTQISIARLVKHLRACIKLEALVVNLSAPSENDDPSWMAVHSVFMPHLQQLQIKTGESLAPLFQRYCFPQLMHLEIDEINPIECVTLWDCMKRSDCLLDLLVIRVPNLPVEDLMTWFDLPFLQSVHTLIVDGVDVTDDILRMLHCPPLHGDQPTYFENLQHLGLGTSRDIDPDVLLRMLGSRYWTAADSPVLKTELLTAVFGVYEKTGSMRMYEQMINDCGARIGDWKDWDWRQLTIGER